MKAIITVGTIGDAAFVRQLKACVRANGGQVLQANTIAQVDHFERQRVEVVAVVHGDRVADKELLVHCTEQCGYEAVAAEGSDPRDLAKRFVPLAPTPKLPGLGKGRKVAPEKVAKSIDSGGGGDEGREAGVEANGDTK
jgi:hypothetical protein